MNFIKYKNLILNIGINMFSAGILTMVVQLFIFPLVSREIGANDFGIAVTLYGFNNLISVFLGNTINNIRLIYDKDVKQKGNFTTLIIVCLFICFIISTILYYLYGENLRILELTILVFLTLLTTLKAYLLVYFRIEFNYINIFKTNIVIITGYLMGLLLFVFVEFWGVIFLIGEIFGVFYLLFSTSFLNEPMRMNASFKPIIRETVNLTFSNGISHSFKYLDRFLIIPILGTTSMSMYYSVSVFSKIINLIVTPFNNVILSYLNNIKKENIRKFFLIYNILSILLLIPIYFIMIYTTPYLLNFFYPQYFEIGKYLIPAVSLANVLNLLTAIINPLILKFYKMKFQVNIQIIYGLVYIISALFFIKYFGLLGFAYSTAFSFFIKWLIMFLIGMISKK